MSSTRDGVPGIREADQVHAGFLARYPAYTHTTLVDQLRNTQYRRLDDHHQVYLDYTGACLYPESQHEEHFELLRSGIFGHVERTRRAVMKYFNAPPEDYILVFTQNASAALKLVGDSYPFSPSGRFLLTFDNHN